jgi:hypothetical protein
MPAGRGSRVVDSRRSGVRTCRGSLEATRQTRIGKPPTDAGSDRNTDAVVTELGCEKLAASSMAHRISMKYFE